MLQPGPPGIRPDLLEYFQKACRRKGPLERRHVFQRIEAQGFRGDRIKVEKIALSLFGNIPQHLLRQVTMRVEQGHAFAVRDVLRDERFQER